MHRSEGASALEFAIVAPIIILLILGAVELSLMYQAQLAVTHAAREGARMAIVGTYDEALVIDRAFPLTAEDGLSVSASEAADSITVVVTYPYEPRVLPLIGEVMLHSEATMRKES